MPSVPAGLTVIVASGSGGSASPAVGADPSPRSLCTSACRRMALAAHESHVAMWSRHAESWSSDAEPSASASLFLIATVFSGIGMTPEQTALVVGFILPFDRFLDMIRTVVNVTGDLTAATIVARRTGEIDLEVFENEPER